MADRGRSGKVYRGIFAVIGLPGQTSALRSPASGLPPIKSVRRVIGKRSFHALDFRGKCSRIVTSLLAQPESEIAVAMRLIAVGAERAQELLDAQCAASPLLR